MKRSKKFNINQRDKIKYLKICKSEKQILKERIENLIKRDVTNILFLFICKGTHDEINKMTTFNTRCIIFI